MLKIVHTSGLKKFFNHVWHFLISNVGAFFIGFSALLIGVYQFYVNRPIIEYDAASHNFISALNDNKFKVIVENKEYDTLYQTIVIMKNNGQQALSGGDVSRIGHNPIRILVPPAAKMVHFTVDKPLTSPAVDVELKEYQGNIIIGFDFLNPGDQIAVTILHQNPSEAFKIVGSALGVTTIDHVMTERELLWIVVSALVGIYILTVVLGILERNGYL